MGISLVSTNDRRISYVRHSIPRNSAEERKAEVVLLEEAVLWIDFERHNGSCIWGMMVKGVLISSFPRAPGSCGENFLRDAPRGLYTFQPQHKVKSVGTYSW